MKSVKQIKLYTFAIIFVLTAFLLLTILELVKAGAKGELKLEYPEGTDYIEDTTRFLDKYWGRLFVKKEKFSKADSLLGFYTTGYIFSEQVILGENGWLFYKAKTDSNPIGDYEGTISFTEKEVDKCLKGFEEIRDYCDENNIKYSAIIVPNKERVYPEYMPGTYKFADESRTDKLANTLADNGYNVINCKEGLLDRKKGNQLYYSYDTHWNRLGANIGLKLGLESMSIQVKPADELTISSIELREVGYHYCGKDDLAEMLGMREIEFNDEVEYEFDEYPTIDWDEFEKEQEAGEVSYFYNPDAENKAKLLLIGDSFRTALVPGLSYYFSDVYIVHVNNSNKKVIKEVKPDYLLLQYVERYSYRLLDIDRLVK
ncbi:MAG: hypothetical protein E7296_09575 [Lachnospiraceae bacterium]|jgi:hypothetical protein|nr:hypothetical protein [Lachnospiraceae bacterium]